MQFDKFRYQSLAALREDCAKKEIALPLLEDTGILARPVSLGPVTAENSIALHPMEGNDGNADGTPSGLTERRYMRFAESGAGLIWFEAIAVVREGRAAPFQLWITRENVGAFSALVDKIRAAAAKRGHNPVIIAQLTHSGRFSRPEGTPAPLIAYHNPYLNQRLDIKPDYPVVTDDYLRSLEERFGEAAELAIKAGFDGVDMKCCHRYLNCELLSAYNREGDYGGSFENRTRFLKNIVARARGAIGGGRVTAVRLNAYDGIPYPFGFGTDREDYRKYDLAEPIKVIAMLKEQGVGLLNLTMGTPYYNPHVNRPYDSGTYTPEEHPLEGTARLINGIGELQRAFPELPIVGTGFSWLRQFSPNLAAGCKENGLVTLAGFGREAFAYPDFPRDILEKGKIDPGKCCIACGKCAELLRAGMQAGCVIRDGEVYAPLYKELLKKQEAGK